MSDDQTPVPVPEVTTAFLVAMTLDGQVAVVTNEAELPVPVLREASKSDVQMMTKHIYDSLLFPRPETTKPSAEAIRERLAERMNRDSSDV